MDTKSAFPEKDKICKVEMDIKLSRLAELDLEEIWLYSFETWSLDQANKYQDILFLGMNEISLNLNLAKSILLSSKSFQYHKIGHHYLFFNISDSDLLIYRVLHESMDFDRHL